LLAIVPAGAYRQKMITRAQIRAARALIGWTQIDLAQASGISQVAIKNLERGVTDPRVSTLISIQDALDQAGVMFLEPGDTRDGGAGVRLKRQPA
jgi:transcriptional regulator with XRE-family HTH domain